MGLCEGQQEHWQQSIEYLTKSIDLKEHKLKLRQMSAKDVAQCTDWLGWYYQNRGYALLRLHEFNRAIPDLTRAIQIHPKQPENYLNRARAYELLGMSKEGARDRAMAKGLGK